MFVFPPIPKECASKEMAYYYILDSLIRDYSRLMHCFCPLSLNSYGSTAGDKLQEWIKNTLTQLVLTLGGNVTNLAPSLHSDIIGSHTVR